jgi:surface antigen
VPRGAGTAGLVSPGTISAQSGRLAEKLVSQGATGKGSGGNPFPGGWCTWGAWEKAQWLGGAVTGNANQWAAQAQAAGLQVGTTPAVGAVYVNTAGYYGHVGVVTKVNSPTNFDMVDMNGGQPKPSPPAQYGETYDFGVFRDRVGKSTGPYVRFIYQPGGAGPADGSTGPVSGPPPGNGRLGVIDNAGNFYAKAGMNDNWTLETYGATAIAVSDGRLGVIDNAGNFYAKAGMNDNWTLEANGVRAIGLR